MCYGAALKRPKKKKKNKPKTLKNPPWTPHPTGPGPVVPTQVGAGSNRAVQGGGRGGLQAEPDTEKGPGIRRKVERQRLRDRMM